MSDVLRVARFYWVLLAIFTVGRWVMSLRNVPYDKGHHVFSIVILTFIAVVFMAAFCRAWRGYTLGRAAMLGAVIGFSAQVVIFASTVISYLLGMNTYFNHPQARSFITSGRLVTRPLGLRSTGSMSHPNLVPITT